MLNPSLDRGALGPRAIALTALLLLALALPIAVLRAAQTTPLPLEGAVYDTTGARLPGVALSLDGGQGRTWQATSDDAGRFKFEPIAPGQYVLEAVLEGFRPLRQEIDLGAAADWERAVTLQVGSVRETIRVTATRVRDASPVPTAPKGPTRVRIGGSLRAPTKLTDVKPIFPETMRAQGRQGTVPMEAIIGKDGSVLAVRVLSAQVHPDFAIAAVDAVRGWRYQPTLLNGQPVEIAMTVSVSFNLAD